MTELSEKTERSVRSVIPPPVPTRSRRGEMFAIAASGLDGLLSLLVSTYNVYLQRAQVRAQVWPNVEWLYNDGESYERVLKNTGVGPAKIAGARMSIDGKAFDTWIDLLAEIRKLDPLLTDGVTRRGGYSQIRGRTVPAGAEIDAVKVSIEPAPVADAKRAALLQAFERVTTEICYCSTLDDCWLLNDHEDTKLVSKCPMDRLTFKN